MHIVWRRQRTWIIVNTECITYTRHSFSSFFLFLLLFSCFVRPFTCSRVYPLNISRVHLSNLWNYCKKMKKFIHVSFLEDMFLLPSSSVDAGERGIFFSLPSKSSISPDEDANGGCWRLTTILITRIILENHNRHESVTKFIRNLFVCYYIITKLYYCYSYTR